VLRDVADGPVYHVRFPGRTLQVPEGALTEVESAAAEPAEEQG